MEKFKQWYLNHDVEILCVLSIVQTVLLFKTAQRIGKDKVVIAGVIEALRNGYEMSLDEIAKQIIIEIPE